MGFLGGAVVASGVGMAGKWALVGVLLAGCSGPAFECVEDMGCVRGEVVGTCEAVGYCSFGDGSCGSGRRFGELAPAGVAGRCVVEEDEDGSESTGAPPSPEPQPAFDEADASSSGEAGPVETCDGEDDDGDGLVDEVSTENAYCDGCDLFEVDGIAVWTCRGPLTWADAVEACEARGAQLAIIRNAEEQAALQSLPWRGGFWIGASDVVLEGAWRWVDGSIADYTHWDTAQPDNANGGQHCARIFQAPDDDGRPGGWDDRNCTVANAFMCTAR